MRNNLISLGLGSVVFLMLCAAIMSAGCTSTSDSDICNISLYQVDTLETQGDMSLNEAIADTSGANAEWAKVNAESALTQYENALIILTGVPKPTLCMNSDEYKTRVTELELKYAWAKLYMENYDAADKFEKIWYMDYPSFLSNLKVQIAYFENYGYNLKKLNVIASSINRNNMPSKYYEMITTIRYDCENTLENNDKYLTKLYSYQ